jgi:twinkle protein
MTDSESVFLRKEPCPACGSRDNLGRYSDGHGHCFGCGHYEPGTDQHPQRQERRVASKDLLPIGDFTALTKRKLTEDTCKHWGYFTSTHSGKPVQVATYRDAAGNPVAQKVRYPDKTFSVRGDLKSAGLYGQWLWRDGGKKVVVTEGEIDALTVSQLQGNKWPVVSVPNGAQGAAKAVAAQLEWLMKFDEVIFMFDNDEPGRAAAQACAEVLPMGKAKIATLPLKDPSEMLQAGRGGEVIDAMWGAKAFRPDGIVTPSDIRDEVLKPIQRGLAWWSPTLDAHTYGRRFGEIYAVGAGTGVGKTDFLLQQIEYDLVTLNQPVGVFFLEQQPVETGRRLAGKHAGKPFHIPDAGWTEAQLMDAWGKLEALPLYLFNHFGSADWSNIQARIRFLNKAHGVRIFYLDHLTALATGGEDGGSEREVLEAIMAEMGGLVKELDIMIILVSHLATPEGKSHEEGGRVMIRHFKGARAIGFWCHYMFGLERDQQADDERVAKTTVFRVLKDRYTGRATGKVIYLGYDEDSTRLFETEAPDVCPNPSTGGVDDGQDF